MESSYDHLSILGDRPHRGSNAGARWYVHLGKGRSFPLSPCPAATDGTGHCCMFAPAFCFLCAQSNQSSGDDGAIVAVGGSGGGGERSESVVGDVIEEGHFDWLRAEHARQINRARRLAKRQGSAAPVILESVASGQSKEMRSRKTNSEDTGAVQDLPLP